MYFVGFATAVEIEELRERGFDVEDAPVHCVGPEGAEGEGYLLTKPEPGPNGTKAISIFLDAALYDVLVAQQDSEYFNASAGSLDVVQFTRRKNELQEDAYVALTNANDTKYCSHKNPDGSDARYATGGGARACICGEKWD